MGNPTTIAIVLAASFVASAAQGGPAQRDAVQAVDARFRKAMTEGNASEVEQIVADDAKIIHGNRGGIQDKAGLIREFRSYGIERYERTPVYSTENGNSAVLVSVTHKFFFKGPAGRYDHDRGPCPPLRTLADFGLAEYRSLNRINILIGGVSRHAADSIRNLEHERPERMVSNRFGRSGDGSRYTTALETALLSCICCIGRHRQA